MKQKYYWIIGIVILIVIIGVIISILPSQQTIKEQSTAPPQDTGKIEATILSLRQIDWCPYSQDPTLPESEECPLDTNPSDSATIIVDSILEYQRDPRAEYLPLSVGMQFDNADFSYSSRPAKVIHIPIQSEEPGPELPPPTGPVQPPSVETPPILGETPPILGEGEEQGKSIPRENGLYVYTIYSGRFAEEYETILSGVSEGDRIRIEIVYSDQGLSLEEYEIIS